MSEVNSKLRNYTTNIFWSVLNGHFTECRYNMSVCVIVVLLFSHRPLWGYRLSILSLVKVSNWNSEPIRFIPKSVSEPIRIHPSQSEEIFQSRWSNYMKGSPGGGQNLERRNVERPIFRNYNIANIKITNDELFDSFIFEFFFSFFRNY